MSSRQIDTAAPVKPEPAPAHQAGVPEAEINHVRHDPLLSRAAPGADLLHPTVRAAALHQASGGQLARAGHALLKLQQQHGNRYVQRLVSQSRQADPLPVVQAKLTVGPAGDEHEREADWVAQQVLNETAKRQTEGGRTTRRPVRETALLRLNGAAGEAVDAGVQHAIQQARGGGHAIPAAVRAPLERAFGTDLSGVRVHTDTRADRLNRPLLADAFTTGGDIFFRRGRYAPHTRGGQHLLAHELTHVVQQNGTPARPGQRPAQSAHDTAGFIQLSETQLRDAAGRLKKSAGAETVEQYAKVIANRLRDGPPFTVAELHDIDTLSSEEAGINWLKTADIGTADEANQYLRTGNYKRWLKLSAGQRVHYASRAWATRYGADDENPPPSYTLGRHMAIQKGAMSDPERAAAIGERDAHIRRAFANTMAPMVAGPKDRAALGAAHGQKNVDNTVQAANILAKIFFILQSGLQVQSKTAGTHIDYNNGDVARALAHGGRVNIRIPALRKGESAHALTDWIGITEQGKMAGGGAIKERGFGTHHMNITENKKKRRGKFEETGGKTASLANKKARDVTLWGMNVAGGGIGKRDFNGDVILPDGAHGHMFIGFTKPTRTKDGALQIGMETTAPKAASLVGYKHNWRSTDKTANPESTFYGHKSAKIGSGTLKGNQRYVDLKALEANGKHWHAVLQTIEDDWWNYLRGLVAQAQDQTQVWQAAEQAFEELVGPRKY